MKSYSLVLLVVLSLIALSFAAWIGQSKPTPPPLQNPPPTADDLPMPKSGPYGKAEIVEKEFDFGIKHAGDTDTHIFKLKNVGEGILEFKLGKPSCQCTLGEVTRDNGEEIKEGPIAPGETVNIQVKWVMKMPNEKFRQFVPVFTTDPDNRKIEFSITGVISTLYEYRPEGVWNVGDIIGNEPAHAEGYFISKVLDEFTLVEESHRSENSKLKLTIEPVEAQSTPMHQILSGYQIKVEVGADIPFGRFRESFSLKASSEKGEKIVEFFVLGNRPGPMEIRGVTGGAGFNPDSDRLLFKDFLASTGAKATMTLFVKGYDGDLAINSVEPENSRVKVKLIDGGTQLGKTKAYKVSVEVEPGAPVNHRAENAELINLKLNHPEVPDFRLLIDYNALR